MRFRNFLLFFGLIGSLAYPNISSAQTEWKFSQNEMFCALEATSAGVPLRIQYTPPSREGMNATIISVERPSFLSNWWNDKINWPPADEFHYFDEENEYTAVFGVIPTAKMNLPMWSNYGEDAKTRLGEDHNIVQMFIKYLAQDKAVSIYMDHSTANGWRTSRLGRWTSNGAAEDEKTLAKFKNCVFGN